MGQGTTDTARLSSAPPTAGGALTNPLGLVAVFPMLLLVLAGVAGARQGPVVLATLGGSAAAFTLWLFALRAQAHDDFQVVFAPIRSHWVQALVQSAIYVYWGWYWRPVYEHIPLIIAQILFVYSFDALLSLTRRRRWAVGFGPFPIILSTNLFLLFKPEFFYLQFAMIGLGVLGKEFLRWERNGRNTHIFNPSAFGLFVFSVGLIVTGTTDITWGEEIATTLNNPPHIYLQIFVLGLIVQALFSVTLVTLWAVLSLVALNFLYTTATGVYLFVDSNIPIAVFLGLHLLVTDPATSPRASFGKVLFGASYGVSVFALYWFLDANDLPRFYDKLLCVPILNLMVPLFDGVADRIRGAVRWPASLPSGNVIHMSVWIVVFAWMYTAHFVGPGHSGTEAGFWREACEADQRHGCRNLLRIREQQCGDGNAAACLEAGAMRASTGYAPDPLRRGEALAHGCDRGSQRACLEFADFIRRENGGEVLRHGCDAGSAVDCYLTGLVARYAIGGATGGSGRVVEDWSRACEAGWPQACAELGDMMFLGDGEIAKDVEAALPYLDRACRLGVPASCANLSMLYGSAEFADMDDAAADHYARLACDAGVESFCGR